MLALTEKTPRKITPEVAEQQLIALSTPSTNASLLLTLYAVVDGVDRAICCCGSGV